MSGVAVIADMLAIYTGFLLAIWIRFDSGWVPLFHAYPSLQPYTWGAVVATWLFIFVFISLGLYTRPQLGHFVEKIPRIIRAISLGILLAVALSYIVNIQPPFSRLAIVLSFATVTLLVLIERNVLFQLERHLAKYQASKKNVVILGIGSVAGRLRKAFESEPRLRSNLTAFFRTGAELQDPLVPPELIHNDLDEFPVFLELHQVDEVIVANPSALTHQRMLNIIGQCEQALANFKIVPDIFRLLTSGADMQSVDGIPMLGVGKWPLDYFWNRALKRMEDVGGALLGLVASGPVIILAGLLIKSTSRGPVFYKQERCGEKGAVFTIYKLRTMDAAAEDDTGPVWTTENDPRRTRLGSFIRRYNIDELPQFWNVLKGDMSLVGPRPERPYFVEQFKENIHRYMWRHVYKPGLTGWAQVNGLRGNTSIHDRIKHDLFYLENWSLGLDFKILLKTFFARENAY